MVFQSGLIGILIGRIGFQSFRNVIKMSDIETAFENCENAFRFVCG